MTGVRPGEGGAARAHATVNEWPQPQRVASCGFLNLNPWNIIVFSQSSTDPPRYRMLFLSQRTRTVLFPSSLNSRTRSPGRGGSSSNSIAYENPEQPPPRTPTRIAPCGVPRFKSFSRIISTALGETAIVFFDTPVSIGATCLNPGPSNEERSVLIAVIIAALVSPPVLPGNPRWRS